jgi:quinoprotein glucose dehydrogenase
MTVRRYAAVLLSAALGCQRAASVAQSGAERPAADASPQYRMWNDYGGGPDQSKFVAFDQITKANVARLRQAWIYPSGDSVAYQLNPIIVDSVMYVTAKNNSLVAINAKTGREIWIHANLRGMTRRGINYWESADRSERRILFTTNNYLQAIDARTGQSIRSFGDSGIVDLREGLDRDPATIARIQPTTPGKVFENLLILGSSTGEDYLSSPGHVRAYDVRTGKPAWIFHTIPHPGEVGYETWPKDAYKYVGGVNAWGEMSVDLARGIVYVPLGSPTYDYYGADRTGANLFGSSLVALDARTGTRRWHFQFVHHDLWDYDPTAAPQLITVRRDGKIVDAVAQATKQGFMFVFNRLTGEPIWPIEERAVPPSDVPGEKAWPTQPFPAVLPPFARQTMTADDLTPIFLTPTERDTWTRRVNAARKGLYLPPSLTEETVAAPGAVGGANWGNTAADPSRGVVYVLNQDFPSFYRLERRGGRGAATQTASRGQTTFARECADCHGERGRGGSAPAIADSALRLNFGDFRFIVTSGGSQMPAFPHIDEPSLRDVYAYLLGRAPGSIAPPPAPVSDIRPSGPVVASGGALAGRAVSSGRGGVSGYPVGVDTPAVRYSTDYGLGHPYIMRPPWSTLIAYDLNRGTIKWKVPIGQDLHATEAGASNTGVPRGTQRNGMVVTPTGIVFATAKDGKVYAFDAEDGRVLWSGALPMGTEGLPSMYMLDGKQYLVVNATTPLTWGRQSREGGINSTYPRGVGGYVVFALP